MILFVFDIDDTISETALMHQQFFIESLKEMGVQHMDTNFSNYKHHTDSYIARCIYESDKKSFFASDKIKEYEQKVLERFRNNTFKEIPGAVNFIKKIRLREEIAIAFATGAVRATAEYKLDKLGIPFLADQLVASNDIEDREGIVQKAIEQAKDLNQVESFERILSFGDGIWDFKTAINLNLEFVGIGLKNRNALKNAGSKLHFDDFQSNGMLENLLK